GPAVAMAHNLSCIICLDPFTVPVTVPCGHTFCRDCITACPESQRVPCRDSQYTGESTNIVNGEAYIENRFLFLVN
uniref:RING-type domain-containing protein n=1 Tax=Oncorhynchus kisutch TaxID=8019 RepID=A0A8C7FS10_ONCKI